MDARRSHAASHRAVPLTQRGLRAGTRTIMVPLTATGRAAKRHKSKLKIQATLTVARRTGTATATLRA